MADGITVLHVEDDPAFADIVTIFLERHDDISIETAHSVADAEELLETASVDCVVSDYDMPGRNGLDFLEAVNEEDPDLPFLLFTGKGSEEIASRAITAGASGYLQKGGGSEQYDRLAKRIRTLVGEYRAKRRVDRAFAAIEDVNDGIALLDDDGRVVYLNESYASFYGYDRESLLGETWNCLYPDPEVRRYEEEIWPTLEEDGEWVGDVVAVRDDGTEFRSTHSLTLHDDESHTCVIYHGSVENPGT